MNIIYKYFIFVIYNYLPSCEYFENLKKNKVNHLLFRYHNNDI